MTDPQRIFDLEQLAALAPEMAAVILEWRDNDIDSWNAVEDMAEKLRAIHVGCPVPEQPPREQPAAGLTRVVERAAELDAQHGSGPVVGPLFENEARDAERDRIADWLETVYGQSPNDPDAPAWARHQQHLSQSVRANEHRSEP